MRIVRTAAHNQARKRNLFRLAYGDVSVHIDLDATQLPSGIFASAIGDAYVSQPYRSFAGDYYNPPEYEGGEFSEHGDYEIYLYDGQGEPLTPLGQPDPQQRTYKLSELQPQDAQFLGEVIKEKAEELGGDIPAESGRYNPNNDPDHAYETWRDMQDV
tara:strand:+ start:210495 stop:210968 length:474 start_codon:yes stop_codon:yes gene_type:complete